MHVTGLMNSADNLIELAVSCPQIFFLNGEINDFKVLYQALNS